MLGLSEGRARLPVFPDRLIERALSKLEKIQDDTAFHRDDLEFSLSAYFYGKAGSVSFRTKQPAEIVAVAAEDQLDQSQETAQVAKSQIVNKAFLEKFQEYKIIAYTVNSYEEIQELETLGVYGVFCNYPDIYSK